MRDRFNWRLLLFGISAILLVCLIEGSPLDPVFGAGRIPLFNSLFDDSSSLGSWPVAGQNLNDTRNQSAEHLIGPANVARLTTRWVFRTDGDVSATPTVSGNAVYFPDWAGNLYAVEKDTGKLIWSHKISDYDGVAGSLARVSPAIHGDLVIVGDIQSKTATHQGANVIAVDRTTGALRWITQADSHPAAIITGSPVVFRNIVYQGVSSNEESLALNPAYSCCTFRGSVVALRANTGEMLWKTYVMPDNGSQTDGYSGGAVWQPGAIDPLHHSLYIGTGNNYTVPASVLACEEKAIVANNPKAQCTAPDDHSDTAISLDLTTGTVKWATSLESYDAWTDACLSSPIGVNCPAPHGPDFDLGGSGPNLLPHFVGFGQKSGIYWALNRDNGKILWGTLVGPGSGLGGIEWGSASDGRAIYAAISNLNQTPYTLVPSGKRISWGSWSALDVSTGKILWQTADPVVGALDLGSVSVANGVVYAGSDDAAGHMYALDAKTGQVLWSFASGGSVIDGPSIVDGTLFWGSGYSRNGTGNHKLYAFSLSRN